MSDEQRHALVSRLFLAAARLAPAERDAFLERECGDRESLRREIVALLARDEDRPEILDTGVLPFRARRSLDTPPARIGAYRILEQIGEGGMGVVYRARQDTPIRRTVAIKLIRRGLETDQILARFDSERQALARMSHPAIAAVIDAGRTDDGRPFVVMEYVDGEPVTEFCERKRLGIEERLRLFVRICEGVQHAHRNAVIHRDVKPSNVLVTTASGKAEPKIIDFGVAKADDRPLTDRLLPTEHGQVIGTPDYMSPEQAGYEDRPVDTRTDVYSLGVVLYELLCGKRPFDGETHPDEIRRRIREEIPRKPSSRIATTSGFPASRVRGDLDAIVACATAKRPEDRYGSPADLAADVERHLAGDAVEATSPGAATRALRFAARHRLAVSLAGTILVLILGFGAGMAILAGRLARESRRADTAARHSLRQAEAALEVSDFLVWTLLAAENPEETRRQLEAARDKIEEDVRRELLYPGAGVSRDDAFVRKARLLLPLGRLRNELGFDDGIAIMREALDELHVRLPKDDPEVLGAMHDFGVQLAHEQRFPESYEMLREVYEIRREVLGESHLDTLEVMSHLARVATLHGRPEEATRLAAASERTATATLGPDHRITLRARGYLGNLALRAGDLDRAAEILTDTVTRMRAVVGPDHGNTLACTYMLGAIDALEGRTAAAVARVKTAVDGGWRFPGRGLAGMYDDPHLASLRGDPAFEAVLGPDGYATAVDRARGAAREGRIEDALAWLETAEERGLPSVRPLVGDPAFGPLRRRPAFERLLERLASPYAGPRM